MIVKRIGNRDIMLMTYWDGGYVTLDVTNPAAPVALSDTDFAAADPARAEYGQTITPEGNAHQAEFTRDNKYFFATDEDFDPYRVQATFQGGPPAGKTFTAIQADTPAVTKDNPLTAPTQFVGLGCDPLAAGSGDGQDRGGRARHLRLPGEAGQRPGGGLRRPDRLQPPRHRRLRDAGLDAGLLDGDPGDVRVAHGRVPPARRRAGLELHVRHRVGDGRHRHAGRPVGARGHLRHVRRLGLHAHVRDEPHARREDEGDGHLRAARGPAGDRGRGLRRHDGPRGRDRPRQELRLRLALRARHACPLLRRQRPQGGRCVRGVRRLQLLGRRGPQARRRPQADPRIRPRPRPADLRVPSTN